MQQKHVHDISEHAISDAFLPGLRSLLEDARQFAPCHEPAVAAMIADFEAKLDCTRERAPSLSSPMASMEEMKRKMTKIFTEALLAKANTQIGAQAVYVVEGAGRTPVCI
ncbi:hypothetical protein V5799_015295 [Amblyomma americanum]|uniref:Uncharacterized protein n=1 Tax=Amblyomma americanum TaxID=6943 RepID=A0AAQ4E0K0_AMBAM